jgi:surfactin synthase thioesterase subunit
MKAPQASWIAYRKANPQARLRIFCFPHAGGGASIFRGWQPDLPGAIDVCPVQIPGRETRVREPAYSRIEPMVEALCQNLKQYFDLPYALFGYSMGALIAFELAHAVQKRGLPGPCHLLVAAYRGPRLAYREPSIEGMGNEEFIRELTRSGGLSPQVLQDREFLELLLPTLRADYAVCEKYTCSAKAMLRCPMGVFGGAGDAKVPEQDLRAWCAETSASCNVKLFEGGHFFIHSHREALLQTIADELSVCIGVLG